VGALEGAVQQVVRDRDGYSVGATTVWENSPMWDKVDDALKPFRVAARGSRMIGWAGPPRARPLKSSRSTSSPTCTRRPSRERPRRTA